jgi:hypothetical protein
MIIGVIRDKSENCEKFKYPKNREIPKNKFKTLLIFSKILSDLYSGWCYQLGLKGPPAPAHDLGHVEDL